jgi:hypothetical protein
MVPLRLVLMGVVIQNFFVLPADLRMSLAV